MIEIVYVKISF